MNDRGDASPSTRARRRILPATSVHAARAHWLGIIAMTAVVAVAAAAAWRPLYEAARTMDGPFIASLEVVVIIGLPISAAMSMLDRVYRGERLPPIATTSFFAIIAFVLIVADAHSSGVAGLAMRTAPVLGVALGVAWLIAPAAVRAAAAELEQPLPEPTVLYRFYDADGALLYVGITRHWERRLRAHSIKRWYPAVARTDLEVYGTRDAAARAEHAAITTENPIHNVARLELEAHLRTAGAR